MGSRLPPLTKEAGLLSWGAKKILSFGAKTGDALLHGARAAPGEMAMGVGGLALTIPALRKSPEAKVQNKVNRELSRQRAQSLQRSMMPDMSKSAGVPVIRDLVRLHDRAELEKLAAGSLPKPHQMFLLGAGLALGNQAIEALSSGVEGGARGAKDAFRAKTREARWRRVVRFDRDLKDMPHARDAFNALDRASPYVSGEPMLAASAVRQLASYGSSYEGGPPNVPMPAVKNLLDIQRARSESRGSSGRRGAFGEVKAGPELAEGLLGGGA